MLRIVRRMAVWGITLMLLWGTPALAQVSNFLLNGQASGAVFVQGEVVQWSFNLSVGGTAMVELWYDVDANGIADDVNDLMLFQFPMTDGRPSDEGPGDMDESVNGQINVMMPLGLAPVYYVMVASEAGVSDTVDFSVLPVPNPAFTVWGHVQDEYGMPVENMLVQCDTDADSAQPDFWWAFTDSSGDYIIGIDSSAANTMAPWRVSLEEKLVRGYIVTPHDTMIYLMGDHGPIDFVLTRPAMYISGQVTDPDGLPIPIMLGAWAYNELQNINRNADVDSLGFFTLAFAQEDTGEWRVGIWSDEWGMWYMEPPFQTAYLTAPGDSLFLNFVVYPTDTVIWGVLDAGGDPIVAGRRVYVWNDSIGRAEAQTDEMGYFSVRVAGAANSYRVDLDWGDLQEIEQAGYHLVTPMPLFVAPGDTARFEFSAGGSIEGIVLAYGAPVAGALVWAEPFWGGPRHVTVTDTNGFYRISGLAGGRYRVAVPPHNGYAVQFYDHRDSWPTADPVDVPEGGVVRGIDFDLEMGGYIAGFVDDGAAPLPDIRVVIFHADTAGAPAGPPTRTGLDGSYLSGPLPPGAYLVMFEDTAGVYQPIFYDQKTDQFLADTVFVLPGDTTYNIDAHMSRESFIAGTVYDTSGTPIPNAHVMITDTLSAYFDAYTDPSGHYRVIVPPGQYIVSAEKAGYAISYWDRKDSIQVADWVNVGPGAAVDSIDFWLVPVPSQSVIAGTVLDENGAAVQSIAVHAIMLQPTPGAVDVYDTTDANGRYWIEFLPPGDYLVEVPAQMGFAAQYFDHQYYNDGYNITPVHVSGLDTATSIDFQLYYGGYIEGQVTGEGNPLRDAEVIFFDTQMNPVARSYTDVNGFYRSPPLQPMYYLVGFRDAVGMYVPEFWQGSFAPSGADSVLVSAGSTVFNINADLGKPLGIAGSVRSQYGIGIPDIWVEARKVTTNQTWLTVTDWTGNYVFPDLPPGDYVVSATDSAGYWETQFWKEKGVGEVPDTVRLVSDFVDTVDFVLHSPMEGKVVISEIMWMGSSLSPNDEWIELHNTSPTEYVDISGWVCAQEDTARPDNWIPLFQVPQGVVLPPDGFYLVSHFDKDHSRINVRPDLVEPNLTIFDNRLRIVLIPAFPGDPHIPIVDVANDGGRPFAGDPVRYRSMQRREVPGRGDDPANWYTSHEWQKVGWDPGAIECGTPGRENTLPVELASFTASVSEGEVTLTWTTATEINALEFEVLRREAKEKEWQRVGVVKARASHGTGASYSFVDQPEAGRGYYYRLRMVDEDGSFRYSSEIFVDNSAPTSFALSQSYPNPLNLKAGNQATIRFQLPIKTRVQISIYNLLGQEVARLVDREMAPGYHRLQWNGLTEEGTLPNAGVYFIRMKAGSFDKVQKILIVH